MTGKDTRTAQNNRGCEIQYSEEKRFNYQASYNTWLIGSCTFVAKIAPVANKRRSGVDNRYIGVIVTTEYSPSMYSLLGIRYPYRYRQWSGKQNCCAATEREREYLIHSHPWQAPTSGSFQSRLIELDIHTMYSFD